MNELSFTQRVQRVPCAGENRFCIDSGGFDPGFEDACHGWTERFPGSIFRPAVVLHAGFFSWGEPFSDPYSDDLPPAQDSGARGFPIKVLEFCGENNLHIELST